MKLSADDIAVSAGLKMTKNNDEGQPVSEMQLIIDTVSKFARDNLQSFGYLKTMTLLFSPNRMGPSWPTEEELQIKVGTLDGGEGIIMHKNPDGTLLQQAKYLGLLLHVSMEWQYHIEKYVIPVVMERTHELRSDVANHDALAPRAAMHLVNVDVMSCCRYGCEIWGVGPWSRAASPQKDALDTLDSLFVSTLRAILGLRGERALDAAIFKELGWGGIGSVFVTSQIRASTQL
jgi:hypothetical protein